MGARTNSRRPAGGFSLLELLIAVTVIGLVLSSVAVVQLRANDASQSMQARDDAETRARRALDRVGEELTGVGRSLIFPDPNTNAGSATLAFQRATGVSNLGVVLWGAPSRLQLQMDTRELDNGADDDGDRIVDERQLILTRDVGTADERTVVLCTGIAELADGETINNVDDNGNGVVDESGFNVRRVGDLLTVRICLQRPGDGGQIATISMQTSIVLHN